MYDRFGLVLMVTHACNLHCSYCFTGGKRSGSMRRGVGRAAIDRAVRSIGPGGVLELGFFGGEPLLETQRIADLVQYAGQLCREADIRLQLDMTTNGTLSDGAAWDLMTMPEMRVTVSHDGLPQLHDRHRRCRNRRGTSQRVIATVRRLLDAGHDVGVNMVVRPDGVDRLPEGIGWLRDQGVRHISTSLDLWTDWDRAAAVRLQEALGRCADLWFAGLPEFSLRWFDEKAARLAGIGISRTARCGFGDGEIAVSPSGYLYPCERLIGKDSPDNPMRLPGHALEGRDFCLTGTPPRRSASCASCAIEDQCSTTCRCSNYIRTGDVDRPDGLLCLLDKTLYRETARVLCDAAEPAAQAGGAERLSALYQS